MAPSVRLKPVLLASLCVFACGLVVWWIGAAFYQAHRMVQESAQLALLAEAAQKLDTYHKEHGEYPTSLDSFVFSYPDGGDASMIADFRYQSDGKTYSLKARSFLDEDEELEVGSKQNG